MQVCTRWYVSHPNKRTNQEQASAVAAGSAACEAWAAARAAKRNDRALQGPIGFDMCFDTKKTTKKIHHFLLISLKCDISADMSFFPDFMKK
jgi:hypothetical protein